MYAGAASQVVARGVVETGGWRLERGQPRPGTSIGRCVGARARCQASAAWSGGASSRWQLSAACPLFLVFATRRLGRSARRARRARRVLGPHLLEEVARVLADLVEHLSHLGGWWLGVGRSWEERMRCCKWAEQNENALRFGFFTLFWRCVDLHVLLDLFGSTAQRLSATFGYKLRLHYNTNYGLDIPPLWTPLSACLQESTRLTLDVLSSGKAVGRPGRQVGLS